MKEIIKYLPRTLYYFIWYSYIRSMNCIYKSKITEYKKIPIIINNRNRLTFLVQLIKALETRGYYNIFIIDNDSTYPPLLNYYDECPYPVFRLKENIGFLSLWQTNIYKQFYKDFYVYTDSDVVPIESCPVDFLNQYLTRMQLDKNVMKVGLSLKIDDIPEYFDNKNSVISWEKKYFEKEENGYYIANIDTTFALYRPYMKGGSCRLKMLRSKYPMTAYHMPWYNDSKNVSEEELFYIKSANKSTHWTSKN